MKKSSKIILTTVLVLGISGAVFAFGSHHHYSNMTMQEKAEMFNYFISRKLDLNTEQEVNLESLTSHFAGIMQQVKQEREQRMEMLDAMLNEGPLDQSLLLQQIGEKTQMVNKEAPEMVALVAQFVDSLDTQQKAELKQMIQKRHSHRGFGQRYGRNFEYGQSIGDS